MEGDDGVAGLSLREGGLDGLEKAVRLWCAVQGELSAEVPVSRVLRIRLPYNTKQYDVR